MRSIRILLPVAALSASALHAQAPQGDLARVQAHLAGLSSMTANFVQTDRTGKALSGVLTLKRPGKVRFQYQKGVPLLIVGDGRALTMIDYQVRQVSRWPIGKSPLAVLLDPSKNLATVAKILPASDARTLIVQARDPKAPEFGTLTLYLDRRGGGPGGLALDGWVAVDAQGNRTQVQLSGQRFNVPVSDEAFRWNDPRRTGRGR